MALAKARGKAMAPPDDPDFDAGTMMAVKGDVDRIREELKSYPDITLANWNSNNQVALAGPKQALDQLQKDLTEKGFSVIPLPVSAAFHTPLVGHAQKPFADVIEQTPFKKPKIKVFSNSTGKRYPTKPEAIREVLAAHILKPVFFKEEIENIYAEGGFFFIEFGPKNVLTNLVKNILAEKPHIAVALNASAKKDSDHQLREAVLQLRIAGLSLNNFDPYQKPLKTTPIKKKSPVAVTLSGGLYITEKTRTAFEEALHDGRKIVASSQNGNNHHQTKNQGELSEVIRNSAPIEGAAQKEAPTVQKNQQPVMAYRDPGLIKSLEKSLADFESHQSETTRLHEQYLKNDAEYSRIFANLSQMEISLLSDKDSTRLSNILPALESLEKSMMRFHDHQAETLRIHEDYLKGQAEFSQSFVQLVKQHFAAATNQTTSIPLEEVKVTQINQTTLAVPASPPAPVGSAKAAPEAVIEMESPAAEKPAPVIDTPAPDTSGGRGRVFRLSSTSRRRLNGC